MLAQGFGLAVDVLLGYGDEGIGPLRTPQQGFSHPVRLQSFLLDLLRKILPAPRVRECGVQRGLATVAMVPVGVRGDPVGVNTENHLGFVPPNFADDLPSIGVGVFQLTVAVTQEHHLRDSEHVGGVLLLDLPRCSQRLRRERAVAGALVAVGAHEDDHLGAGLGDPFGHGGSAPALGVVGMGGNYQGAAWRFSHHSRLRGVLLIGVSPAVDSVRSAGHTGAPSYWNG